MMRRGPIGGLAGAVLFAGAVAAHAGPIASDGTNQLQLQVRVTPARASEPGAPRAVAVALRTHLFTASGERPPANVNGITIRFARGMRMDPEALPQCRETAFNPAPPDGALVPSACPEGSEVGRGEAVIDARPAAQPTTIPVRLFNATIEYDVDLQPTPAEPGVIVYAQDVDAYFVAVVRGRRLVFQLAQTPPGQTDPFTVSDVRTRIGALRGEDGSPYIRAPRRCTGRWRFSETYTLDDHRLTARHSVPCRP